MLVGLLLLTLLGLTAFGGLIVPVLMGAGVWLERREHRIRLAGVPPRGWWVRVQRAAIDRERIASFSHRRLRWSDLNKFWPITAIAFVALMPLAAWASPVFDDMLFAIHPVICVGWWLNMRSRGVIHAEVYALSSWVMAYVAWSLSMLAVGEHWLRGFGGIEGDFVSVWAERLGITSDLVLTLWILYAASGIACVLVGVILARIDRPPFSPLLAVVAWIPFVWVVLNTNFWFGFLGFVVAVGVAGYGIAREVRRCRDDADMRAGEAGSETRATLHWNESTGLILRTAAVIAVAVAIAIAVREFGLPVPGDELGATWFDELGATWLPLFLAAAITALLARLDSRPRVAAEWAAWAWLATVSVLVVYGLFDYTIWRLSQIDWADGRGYELFTIDVLIHVQALVVWLVVVVSVVMVYRAGKLRSYGSLLLGLLWFPIATFAAFFDFRSSQFGIFPDAISFANLVAMGCVLLVIMWRIFGPAESWRAAGQVSERASADAPAGPAEPVAVDGQVPEEPPADDRSAPVANANAPSLTGASISAYSVRG